MHTDPIPAPSAPAGKKYGLMPAADEERTTINKETIILCSEYKMLCYKTPI